MRRAIILFFLCGMVLALSGCADSVTFAKAAFTDPVGFWHGLWHGLILPFSWIGSLFWDDVAIYAIYNNGGWYDFGFILGCGAAWWRGLVENMTPR